MGKCGLLAANTFDGTGRRTWVPTRGQEARLDYLVCSQRWLPMLQRTGTADFSLAIADKEDHRPVIAKFVRRDDGGMTDEDKDRITFDRARLGQEQCREYFCQLLTCAATMPDDVSVDDHERLLRGRFFWYGRHLAKLFLARAFGSGHHGSWHASGWLRGRRAVLGYHLRDWELANRALVREDFEAFVIEKAVRAELAAVKGDSRTLHSIVKGLECTQTWRIQESGS